MRKRTEPRITGLWFVGRSPDWLKMKNADENLRQPFVTCVGDHIEQLFNAIASDRCDDAKLGKMGADRIDHCGLLANEQMAGAMEHQAALLLERLGRNEPHVCPGHRLANGLSVGSIILLPLDVGPYVGRRHQAHRMTKSLQFARPMMG